MPLREIPLPTPSSTHGLANAATHRYFEGGLSDFELRDLLRRLAACPDLIASNRACLAIGYGSHTRYTYTRLAATADVHVLYQGPWAPWFLLPLTFVAASHGGLVQVTASKSVRRVLHRLSQLAMVELYSFSNLHLDELVSHVRQRRWRSRLLPLLAQDSTYFCLGLDGDSQMSDMRLFGWLSFGASCPESLQSLPCLDGGLTKR